MDDHSHYEVFVLGKKPRVKLFGPPSKVNALNAGGDTPTDGGARSPFACAIPRSAARSLRLPQESHPKGGIIRMHSIRAVFYCILLHSIAPLDA